MTGSFAVICLMVAQVVDREVGSLSLDPSPTPGNVSVSSPTPADTSSGLWTPIESVKMEIAISLSLLVGIIQVMYFHILCFRFLVSSFHPTHFFSRTVELILRLKAITLSTTSNDCSLEELVIYLW